jgi:two-component system LytT family response regulator
MKGNQSHNVLLLLDGNEVEHITWHLARFAQFSVVGIIETIEGSVVCINNLNPDVIFVSADLLEKKCFELSQKLDEIKQKPVLVYLKDNNNHAIEAMENWVIYYLNYPISVIDFDTFVEKFEKGFAGMLQLENGRTKNGIPSRNKIRLDQKMATLFINLDDIIYCKASGPYTEIVLEDNQMETVSVHLKNLNEMLDDSFLRVGRSLIINTKHLSRIDKKRKLLEFSKDHRSFSLPVSSRLISKILS